MYARVPQVMAQFVLKIEKLSHIMEPTPILEMARAYGLRPRLWLLSRPKGAKSTQVHVRPDQTESQVDPSFQLASTCDNRGLARA